MVPAVNDPGGSDEQAARTFVSSQYDAGVRILGVCAGSRLLAASGILDGLRATSHWSRIGALEASNADVTWVRGQRYVQDGRVTTTGGVDVYKRQVPVRARHGFDCMFAVADRPENMFTWAFTFDGDWEDFAAAQRPYYRDPDRAALRGVFDHMADYSIHPARRLVVP